MVVSAGNVIADLGLSVHLAYGKLSESYDRMAYEYDKYFQDAWAGGEERKWDAEERRIRDAEDRVRVEKEMKEHCEAMMRRWKDEERNRRSRGH